jgi:hypothetical protein
MYYRIVKREHNDNSIDDEYVVQCIDKHDDWFTLWTYRTLEEAEEHVKKEMEPKEKYVETVVKEYPWFEQDE